MGFIQTILSLQINSWRGESEEQRGEKSRAESIMAGDDEQPEIDCGFQWDDDSQLYYHARCFSNRSIENLNFQVKYFRIIPIV